MHDRHRIELVIALARACLVAAALMAVSLEPYEPGVAYALLVWYGVHSACVVVLLWRLAPARTARFGSVLHAIDVTWALVITWLTGGLGSPFLPLVIFVLPAAACRWGFRQTAGTGLVAVVLLLAGVAASGVGAWEAALQPGSIVLGSTSLLLATWLLAYVREGEKALRAEAAAVNRIVDRIRAGSGFRAGMQAVLDDLLTLLGARRAIVVLEEAASQRLFLWDARHEEGTEQALRLTGLADAEPESFLFDLPSNVEVCQFERRDRSAASDVERLALDRKGRRVRGSSCRISRRLAREDWRTLLALSMAFGEEWRGRLYLLDPTARPAGEARLRFVQGVMRHVTPVVHGVYLLRRLRRLRMRARAIERAGVSRDVPDSVESLAGHRQEILDVRDPVQQLHAPDVTSATLLDGLAQLVERFGRETGIEATFVSDVEAPDVSSQVSRELTRVVQEGLAAARQHSAASGVEVRFGARNGAWVLAIEEAPARSADAHPGHPVPGA